MRAYWCLSQNFGDALTYFLVQTITGAPPEWVDALEEREHLIGVGSILNHASASSIVWGAGIAYMSDRISPNADIRLVRGPLSAMKFAMCGGRNVTAFGDPALLCPRYIDAPEKTHDLGFIPHYIDQSHWPGLPDAKLINVLEPVEKVVADIASCRAIVSSSLHGLIVADAYGIPAAWLYSHRVLGDGTKFADHFLAVSGVLPTPLNWCDLADRTPSQIIEMIPQRSVSFDADAILASFPIELA